jgi:hypothetical protein
VSDSNLDEGNSSFTTCIICRCVLNPSIDDKYLSILKDQEVYFLLEDIFDAEVFCFAAVWQCIRMLGPTVGYLYGSYALQKYVAPSVHPTITSEDPRWIGAWWHGKIAPSSHELRDEW